jgi:hypothetical protein
VLARCLLQSEDHAAAFALYEATRMPRGSITCHSANRSELDRRSRSHQRPIDGDDDPPDLKEIAAFDIGDFHPHIVT